MATYDVPGVGPVTVTIRTHRFGMSDQVLRTLEDVRDAAGREVSHEAREKVDQYLLARGVVDQ